ncbi:MULTISPECIES: ABC transporter permease [unclassified Chelatococcus]|uniref:ABC transporter permease n=1 Tax=unclassified Chelatococcus TaxID=2638111 RepID=UPI001BCA9921|nr:MULTISPECIES: ABC transporter permease [unclassified Chelatococcus]MBS7698543.1 ABC transporter permease [Chelatococcus sp. YT9]MBX3554806.1 ABC transporter permease [Chelatococcus sp.]
MSAITTASTDSLASSAPGASRGFFLHTLRTIWRHRLGRVAVLLLGVLLICAVTAPWISPYDPTAIDYEALLEPPSAAHWFGTDELGRDILSRIIYGATASLQVMGMSIALALVLGVVIGLTTGYFGGWYDDIVMRIMDGLLAFPMMILALAIVATLGPDLINAVIAIAIVNVPGFARLVRGQVLVLRDAEFVQAAESIGMSNLRVLARHIWPNVQSNVIVYASLKASAALVTESALSFLGLGVQPPTPTWGSMLAMSMQYWDAWWMGVFPGLAIFFTVLALNFLGDALRDALDERLND